MVDFDQLKDKAQGLIGDHADQVKQGIDKAGTFVSQKIGGEDKIRGVQDALTGLVDKIAADRQDPPAAPPQA
jgi:hypothetical protein